MDGALRLYHQQTVEVWENFCRLHRELFDLTCEEYRALLSGEIDTLETLVGQKEAVIADIDRCDKLRTQLIQDIDAQGLSQAPITNIRQLLDLFNEHEAKLAIPALTNLNGLLIDIITQTQEQNRRNQLFLNRAMLNLRDIREGFAGSSAKKNFTTYGADGMTRTAGR